MQGFSINKDSPSSGLFWVKVYNERGMSVRTGWRIFARELTKCFALPPLEEEGRLNDLPLRESSMERVEVYPEPAEGPTSVGRRC